MKMPPRFESPNASNGFDVMREVCIKGAYFNIEKKRVRPQLAVVPNHNRSAADNVGSDGLFLIHSSLQSLPYVIRRGVIMFHLFTSTGQPMCCEHNSSIS